MGIPLTTITIPIVKSLVILLVQLKSSKENISIISDVLEIGFLLAQIAVVVTNQCTIINISDFPVTLGDI